MDTPKDDALIVEEVEPAAIETVKTAWNPVACIAFRFVFVYSILYSFPQPLTSIPNANLVIEWYQPAKRAVVRWTAKTVLRISGELVLPAGSGDTTFNFVEILDYFVIATVGAIIWSLAARKSTGHPWLFDLLRTYTRYVLAITMLAYGFAKVFPMQFRFPGPEQLLQAYGDSSPMRLLWTFMGYSVAYTIFAGVMETLGGVLLFCRRTTTLGAVLNIGILTNIFVLNMCYDVPVKLYSAHLLLMAIFLVLPDMSRLLDFLVLNRATAPVVLHPFAGPRWWQISTGVVKLAFVGWILYSQIAGGMQSYARFGNQKPKSALFGVYEVETFVVDGKTLPPLLNDSRRWRRFTVNKFGYFRIESMSGSGMGYALKEGEPANKLVLRNGQPLTTKGELTWRKSAANRIELEGVVEGKKLVVVCRAKDETEFELVKRGFRWINEYPHNR